MSFREKCAWAAFVTTVIAWGGYFAFVVRQSILGQDTGATMVVVFIGVTIVQAVAIAITAAVLAVRAPADAQAPRDERDRVIARRASAVAYFAVLLGLTVIITALHLGLHGRGTIFALIGLFMLGEATRFGTQAIGYRTAA